MSPRTAHGRRNRRCTAFPVPLGYAGLFFCVQLLGLTLGPIQRRNFVAMRNMLRMYPAFWEPGFWKSVALAREAQRRGAMQKLRELAPLIGLLRRRAPRVVVEIGTARGGTFYAWCQAADPKALLVSIDLSGGRFGGGYTRDDVSTFRAYGRPDQRLHFIRADSHRNETRQALEQILAGAKIDFLMIDGDHTYEGVRRDFEMYAPLVGAGNPIAFHDTLSHQEGSSSEVDRFWSEIRGAYRHTEFLDLGSDPLGPQYGGIGVLYWEPPAPGAP
jgi:cephalosporin hydroxylase